MSLEVPGQGRHRLSPWVFPLGEGQDESEQLPYPRPRSWGPQCRGKTHSHYWRPQSEGGDVAEAMGSLVCGRLRDALPEDP